MESLPPELLGEIANNLEPDQISILMQTSKKYYYHLERYLYRHDQDKDEALIWASAHGHLNIIRRLVAFYASIDAQPGYHITAAQMKGFVKRLFGSRLNHKFIQAFYRAGGGVQLSRRLLDRSLMMLMTSDAPIDLVELLLDQAPCPNKTHATGSNHLTSPLSASILQDLRPLFDLLLRRGASMAARSGAHDAYRCIFQSSQQPI